MTDALEAPEIEAAAAFILRLRARGIRDLAVLRAMEAVPRAHFAPDLHAALASRDAAVPIPCGQTMSEPSLVARMMEGLGLTPACRVLEIGSGSGYATAVLARLGQEVLAVERFRALVLHARGRLEALGIANARVEWGDGLGVPAEAGPFDRILIHASLSQVPAEFQPLAAPGAVLVCGRMAEDGPALVRHERVGEGWRETALGPARLRNLIEGASARL